jgi:hypothetical protein
MTIDNTTTNIFPQTTVSINNFPHINVYNGIDFRYEMLDMYNVINNNNMWDYVRNRYTNNYSRDPEIDFISENLLNNEHSGFSFHKCMQYMKEISKIGLLNFYNNHSQ